MYSLLYNYVCKNLLQHFHVALVLLLLSIFSFSCGGNETKTTTSTADNSKIFDTPLIKLPQPGTITIAETQKLQRACKLWFDSTLLPHGFNGGVIVAKNGNVVFEKYTGTVHIPGSDVVTERTPMHIASVSKTFTAMAVLKLWQDGKVNIDEELSKYIPEFNYPGVTVRSLLNHRSGLPNYTYFLEPPHWDETKTVSNEDVLHYLINNKVKLVDISAPNTHFSYCNTNYALLALLIERVTNKKYAEFLQLTFFTPLQMRNTFVYKSEDSSKVTPSYDWKSRYIPFNHLDAVYGDKNIYTTPHDMLIWDRALQSGKLFTPETLAHAYTPYSHEKPGIRNYGLGWRMSIYPNGKKILYHNGWWHGSNACYVRLLNEVATIIVIGNKFTRAVYGAKILCNLFGEYYLAPEEDENETVKNPDSLTTVLKDTILIKKPVLTKKQQEMQRLFKDKNKANPQ